MPRDTDNWIDIQKPHSNCCNTNPFSFDQMRDQQNGIQQINSQFEENKSSCSWSHSSTQSLEEAKNPLIQKFNKNMQKGEFIRHIFWE